MRSAPPTATAEGAVPAALSQAVSAYAAAIAAADPRAVEGLLSDDFSIVHLHPVHRVVDRAAWLRLVPEFRLERFHARQEFLTVHGEAAVHVRLADMTANSSGVDRTGLFAITDHWYVADPGHWVTWQRTVITFDELELPE